MIRIKDGFTGERSLVMPRMIVDWLEQDPLGATLHITDIGFYPAAKHHFIDRAQPIDQYVFIYCVDGEGWYSLHGAKRTVGAGQFFVLPPSAPHAYGADADRPWTIYWMHFKGTLAYCYCDGLDTPHSIKASPNSRINERTDIFEEIFYTLKAGFNRENLSYAHSLLHHFLGSLRYLRQFRDASNAASGDKEADTAQQAIHYMEENLERHLTLKEISDYAGYSPARFSAIFRNAVGHSPLAFFNLLKIQKACAMLDSTDMKINQVSSKLGFDDTFYFSRLFSKIMGISPTEYRNQTRG